ncbi:unnamed protein product [Heligmosomoides polygyrus]|uniref:SRCR domain-containing protein n=1 Tax=Heligmosomoides polygyrus TaxID=6339 RepID=A0A183FUY4_HELPZ|nr:unnamed protein product [Heligmosomoides polygyrus]
METRVEADLLLPHGYSPLFRCRRGSSGRWLARSPGCRSDFTVDGQADNDNYKDANHLCVARGCIDPRLHPWLDDDEHCRRQSDPR